MTFVEIFLIAILGCYGLFFIFLKLTTSNKFSPDVCPKCKIKLVPGKSFLDKTGSFETWVCKRCGYLSKKFKSF